ncbi:MAG: hypothetical protein WCU80_10685 [Paludibacteraceae bacterium]
MEASPSSTHSNQHRPIFVFGSNLLGRHGGGVARAAYLYFGAVMGCGVGMQGRSYAIPTMQGGMETIRPYADQFLEYAQNHHEKHFLVTPIGCGIAGFFAGRTRTIVRRSHPYGKCEFATFVHCHHL